MASPEFTGRGASCHAEGVRINFFRLSPINGAIWCTFSTFVTVTISLPYAPIPPHFLSSYFHESHDRVWCRLGGGSCPHLPPPVTTLLNINPSVCTVSVASVFLTLMRSVEFTAYTQSRATGQHAASVLYCGPKHEDRYRLVVFWELFFNRPFLRRYSINSRRSTNSLLLFA